MGWDWVDFVGEGGVLTGIVKWVRCGGRWDAVSLGCGEWRVGTKVGGVRLVRAYFLVRVGGELLVCVGMVWYGMQ